MRCHPFALTSIALCLAATASAQTPATVDYARDVQPLLRANCYGCHGPALQNGNFRVDRRRDVMPNRVGANGARIVPGNSAASRVYARVSGTSAGLQMPPTGPLPAEQIAIIKAWIEEGADWPDALAGETQRTSSATPLMVAALFGDARTVRRLLDEGADPNARNDAGATALLWAVDDVEKTRALLARGANPNVRSEDGRTPLSLAASRFGAGDVVTALLDAGASLKGERVLGSVAIAGDETMMRLLIARGAERQTTRRDIAQAMRAGCAPCVDLLIESAPGNLVDGARADVADIAATAPANAAGGTAGAGDPKRSPARLSARDAIGRSLPLLQRADVGFLKAAGCVSCHNNSAFEMTTAAARSRGVRVDEASVASQQRTIGAYLESWRERVLQDIPIPGGTDTISFTLAGLAASHYPPDAATDALARYLLRRQHGNGGWNVVASRPPIESSDIAVTALTLRALQAYAPAPQKLAYAESVGRGAAWLRQAKPANAQDYAFTLLGLTWANAEKRSLRETARTLTALQNADGGWSQLPTMQSDAYATGLVLTALVECGGLSAKDTAYRRGVQFLLDTQLEDGSWFVRSRAVPVQPYFESGFPHGRDQFISAAAANWATMALLAGLK
jgi:ankyrin repeat protein